jgi:hypothetical protein
MVSGALAGGFSMRRSRSSPMPFFVAQPAAVGPWFDRVSPGRNPNGAVSDVATRLQGVRAQPDGTTGDDAETAPIEPVGPVFDAEGLGVDRDFTPADIAFIDRVLGFDDEEVAGVALDARDVSVRFGGQMALQDVSTRSSPVASPGSSGRTARARRRCSMWSPDCSPHRRAT